MVINIKDIDINYEIFGDGEKPLLILHGWMGSIPAMAPIWQYFMKYKKVIVLDFPGQGGKSGMLTSAWGVPEYSEMVKEFMEKLNISKPDVIGHSFGGRVIIYLASKYQDLFDKIILTDAAGIKKKTSLKKWIKIRSYKLGKVLLKIFSSKQQYEKKLDSILNKLSKP